MLLLALVPLPALVLQGFQLFGDGFVCLEWGLRALCDLRLRPWPHWLSGSYNLCVLVLPVMCSLRFAEGHWGCTGVLRNNPKCLVLKPSTLNATP